MDKLDKWLLYDTVISIPFEAVSLLWIENEWFTLIEFWVLFDAF